MRPLSVVITAGQRNDATQMEPVLDAIHVPQRLGDPARKRPPRLRLDRAYGARKYRQALRRRGIRMICPERKDARKARLAKGARGGRPPACDTQAYKGRNVAVPRCFRRERRLYPEDGGGRSCARRGDAVAFGRPFIANRDLPCRFALGAQLNAPDPKTFYAALRDVGYTDYPTLRTIGG